MTSGRPRAAPEGLSRGPSFSILTLPGFATGHRHAFVLKGTAGAVLFKPQPVPRDAIAAAIGLAGAALHMARQVHGTAVLEVPGSAKTLGQAPPTEADALVARAPGHIVGVATADCLPVLLASSGGACAAVHAGWRGLLGGVIEAAVERLGGGADLEAAIGPAIGPCCFEVGPEVASRFRARFPEAEGFARTGDGDRSFIDLPAAARAVLSACGVAPARVARVDLCTRCGPQELLESYRRDGKGAGRMIAVIGTARD